MMNPKLLSADMCACVAPCPVLHVTTVVCFPVNEGVPSPQYVQHPREPAGVATRAPELRRRPGRFGQI